MCVLRGGGGTRASRYCVRWGGMALMVSDGERWHWLGGVSNAGAGGCTGVHSRVDKELRADGWNGGTASWRQVQE